MRAPIGVWHAQGRPCMAMDEAHASKLPTSTPPVNIQK